jgi:hypothetical protein
MILRSFLNSIFCLNFTLFLSQKQAIKDSQRVDKKPPKTPKKWG